MGTLGSVTTGIGWRWGRWTTIAAARLKRSRLDAVTFVAITGSAGKTAAKDLGAAVLAELGPCHRSSITTNDEAGIAETVLATTPAHRHSVVEVSATAPGCLDRPLRLVRPRIGVLTLVARDHYSRFKSVEAIAVEKGKVVAALPADGVAVLNLDDPLVREIGERCGRRVVWIGESEGATLRLREARSRYPEPLTLTLEHEGRTYEVETALHGTHLAMSALAALGIGLAAGVPLGAGIAALRDARIAAGRMQIVKGGDGVVFVRDDWKAPLWSFNAPLVFMRDARAERKVLVIGTLSDYSLSASKLYPRIARDALAVGDLVVFVGPHAMRALKARRSPEDASLRAFPDFREAAQFLRHTLRSGDLVLVKGSHKADHLTRLILDRQQPIRCWDDRCRRAILCELCPQLRAGPPSGEVPVAMAQEHAACAPAPTAAARIPVIVGLGNPGDLEHRTPHNVGQRVLEQVVADAGVGWAQQPEGLVATVDIDGRPVRLLRPAASMNVCGPSVRAFIERNGGDPSCCVLVHDDMDLKLGDVRTKHGGGDAGHKGVRSILSSLDTGAVPRVRIGVRRSGEGAKARELVLRPFRPEEEAQLVPALGRATRLVHECIRGLGADGGQPAAGGQAPVPESAPLNAGR